MGIEGGGGFESRGSRLSPETTDTPKDLHEVFDSDLERAQQEHRQTLERLRRLGEIERRGRYAEMSVEIEGGNIHFPSIQIAWPVNPSSAYLLQLDPITTGKGMESGIIAYRGSYGTASRDQEAWELDTDDMVSLESLFGVPPPLNLAIKPTITRWAVAADELAVVMGVNTRTLYVGLGLLLLGHQWLHIGSHEAGHLPNTTNENEAWFKANKLYARRHKPRKGSVISGEFRGLFDLLRKPSGWYSPQPTIGEIVKYGLTSHFLGGQVRIPDTWKRDGERTLRTFDQIREEAYEEFRHFTR